MEFELEINLTLVYSLTLLYARRIAISGITRIWPLLRAPTHPDTASAPEARRPEDRRRLEVRYQPAFNAQRPLVVCHLPQDNAGFTCFMGGQDQV